MKAALLISGTNKQRYRRLKDDLAKNYLLGTNQYPTTFEKALRNLGNYQVPRTNLPFTGSSHSDGVTFIQCRHGTGQGAGQGRGAGQGLRSNASIGRNQTLSTSGSRSAEGPRSNSKGEFHCNNCRETDDWAHNCPQLTNEQQQQLHMNLEYGEGRDEQQHEAHQLMHVMLAQGAELPDNRAYLNGCYTIMAFKYKKYLKEVKRCDTGIKINCNAGAVTSSLMGKYGLISAWYIPEWIANIFLVYEIEKKHQIMYNIWEGYNAMHTASGPVKFH